MTPLATVIEPPASTSNCSDEEPRVYAASAGIELEIADRPRTAEADRGIAVAGVVEVGNVAAGWHAVPVQFDALFQSAFVLPVQVEVGMMFAENEKSSMARP